MAELHVTLNVDIQGVISAMRRFGVALEDIDIRPFLSFGRKDKSPQDWYDLWTKDLL